MSTPVVIGLAAALATAWTTSATRSPLVGMGVALGGITITRRAIEQEQEQVMASEFAPPAAPIPPAAPAQPIAVQANPAPVATAAATASTGDVHIAPPDFSICLPPVTVALQSPAPVSARGDSASRFRPSSDLPTIDATEPLSREQGVLIVAKKDSGKTTTVKAAIRHRFEWTKGHCQWLIADPKGSQFCGLERTDAYLFVDNRNIEDLLGMLETAMAELRRRIENRRATGNPTQDPYLTILIDEWLSLFLYCQGHSKDLLSSVIRTLTTLIVQGREDRIHTWLVTHSHLCGDLGLSSQLRGNLQVYTLGRKPEGRAEALGSIEAAIRDTNLLVDQDLRRDFLKAMAGHNTGEAPLCFNPEQKFLVQLPDLTSFVDWQYPTSAQFDPLNIPVGELRSVLDRISGCESKSAMVEAFGVPKGGKSERWAEMVRLWELVRAEGVEGAWDALAKESE